MPRRESREEAEVLRQAALKEQAETAKVKKAENDKATRAMSVTREPVRGPTGPSGPFVTGATGPTGPRAGGGGTNQVPLTPKEKAEQAAGATGPSGPNRDPLQQILTDHDWELSQFGDKWTVRQVIAKQRWPSNPTDLGRGSTPREAIEDALQAFGFLGVPPESPVTGPTGPTGPTGVSGPTGF